MTEVTFKDPPPYKPRNGRRDWQAIADLLRSRPGEWALVASDAAPATSTQIKRGMMRGMPAGHFDSRTAGFKKGVNNGRCDIYARYLNAADRD
jgi:hypothetical protein